MPADQVESRGDIQLKLRAGLGKIVAGSAETGHVALEQPPQFRRISAGSVLQNAVVIAPRNFRIPLPRMLFIVHPASGLQEIYALKAPLNVDDDTTPLYYCPLPSQWPFIDMVQAHGFCGWDRPAGAFHFYRGNNTVEARTTRDNTTLAAIMYIEEYFNSHFPYYTGGTEDVTYCSEAFLYLTPEPFTRSVNPYHRVKMHKVLEAWEILSLRKVTTLPWAGTPVTTWGRVQERRKL